MANKANVDLDEEQLEELRSVFKSIDLDGNGFIELAELQSALEVVGLKLPGYKVRLLIEEYDKSGKDGKLDIHEFKELYKREKAKGDVGVTFRGQVKERTDIKIHHGTSDKAAMGTTHNVREAELVAFCKWIQSNLEGDPDCSKYFPIQGEDLYKKVGDGILLCKMINKSVPDTIDERTINKTNLSVYRKHENLMLALNSAKSIGCKIVNISAHDLEKGTNHLVMGMLWQIIRIGLLAEVNLASHPGLVLLLEEGETPEDLRKLSPEEILLRWVNYHLRNAGINRVVTNFTHDIKDSEAYIYLLHQIADREKGVTLTPLQAGDLMTRAELMLQEADKLGCRSFVSPGDVVGGNANLNLAFVANLFNKFPALDKPADMDVEIIEETREERTYRNWINSVLSGGRLVHYLYNDLRDAIIIFKLYDEIKMGVVDWSKVHQTFNKLKVNFEKLENCNYAVKLGKESFSFSLVGIGGEDIRDGNQMLTLALVWQCMRAYTLAMLSRLVNQDGKPISEAEIIQWANAKLAGKGSFRSWQDPVLHNGVIILHVINNIRPGVVNWDLVCQECSSEEEKMQNARYAISLARKIGAGVYALPEDIVEGKHKMIMTIFACLMNRDHMTSKSS